MDRDNTKPGEGFTHKIGDIVSISTPKLGTLVSILWEGKHGSLASHCICKDINIVYSIDTVNTSDKIPPWTFGVDELYDNLTARSLLK
jgi:fumarylacetoacetate (FAA) hydrolase family protein